MVISNSSNLQTLQWDYTNLDFSAYMLWAEELILKNHPAISPALQAKILAANKPFELKPETPTNKGILLIHGLLSCPLAMHDMANHLKAQGFLVRSILLPGHGTRPQDLSYVGTQDWIKATEFGIKSLKLSVENVWIGGMSGGGSLALYQALHDPHIKGTILFAPSLKLNHWLSSFSPLLLRINHYLKLNYWPEKDDETDYAKYHSFPLHFAAQAHVLAQTVRALTQKKALKSPLFMVLTAEDETIDSVTALKFFEQQKNSLNCLIWYGSQAKNFSNKEIIYRKSQHLNDNILDYSHASLVFSPNNPHYGIEGDYLPNLHVPTKTITDNEVYFGALTPYNLKNYKLRRLMYNPDYTFMTQKFTEFLLHTL